MCIYEWLSGSVEYVCRTGSHVEKDKLSRCKLEPRMHLRLSRTFSSTTVLSSPLSAQTQPCHDAQQYKWVLPKVTRFLERIKYGNFVKESRTSPTFTSAVWRLNNQRFMTCAPTDFVSVLKGAASPQFMPIVIFVFYYSGNCVSCVTIIISHWHSSHL